MFANVDKILNTGSICAKKLITGIQDLISRRILWTKIIPNWRISITNFWMKTSRKKQRIKFKETSIVLFPSMSIIKKGPMALRNYEECSLLSLTTMLKSVSFPFHYLPYRLCVRHELYRRCITISCQWSYDFLVVCVPHWGLRTERYLYARVARPFQAFTNNQHPNHGKLKGPIPPLL